MHGMKIDNKLQEPGKSGASRTVCFASCRKLNAQVAEVKQSILREFEVGPFGDGEMIQVAVNEAEALAWQTPYPHLFFTTLAREKATAATQWAARQRVVLESTRVLAA